MDQKRSQITEIIKEFKDVLEKLNIKTKRIVLFGSYAKGTAGEYSDIDLVVISDDFKGMDFMQRCEILGRAIAEVMEPIEPLAYTPEEFALSQKQNTSFLSDLLAQSNTIQV